MRPHVSFYEALDDRTARRRFDITQAIVAGVNLLEDRPVGRGASRRPTCALGCRTGSFRDPVLGISLTWAQEITKGRGLIAVGLVIVARWKPMLVLPICLIFGLAEVAALRVQAAGIESSSYLLATLPYVAVLIVLIVGHVMARRNSGMPADLKSIFA